VRLLGYCHEPQKKVIEHSGRYIIVDVVESMLYYEYVPNGNLDKYIFSMHKNALSNMHIFVLSLNF
jgi:disease resistance protein RPM1